MDKLLEAYSGDKARGYDARRAKSGRWQREIAAMGGMLAEVKPRRLVDCPFGTGRWIEQYEDCGVDAVIGIDLSRGMLEEAETKLQVLSTERRKAYRLIEASIFDVTPEMIGETASLIVCIRFLNWVSFADTERAMAALSRLGAGRAILGISVVPKQAGALRRIVYRLALKWANRKGGPSQHVHGEAEILAMLSRLGWRVQRQTLVMSRPSRRNYFYLLERIPA
jgi:ubiquinone/menaquinone biosynthesis C-methylase UbiE